MSIGLLGGEGPKGDGAAISIRERCSPAAEPDHPRRREGDRERIRGQRGPAYKTPRAAGLPRGRCVLSVLTSMSQTAVRTGGSSSPRIARRIAQQSSASSPETPNVLGGTPPQYPTGW